MRGSEEEQAGGTWMRCGRISRSGSAYAIGASRDAGWRRPESVAAV
jgi:hypothetical protein